MQLVETFLWLMVSAVIVLPACIGSYLVFSPSDKIGVQYMDFMHRRAFQPLKDEDFSYLKKMVFGLKFGGVLLLVASTSLTLFLIERL